MPVRRYVENELRDAMRAGCEAFYDIETDPRYGTRTIDTRKLNDRDAIVRQTTAS